MTTTSELVHLATTAPRLATLVSPWTICKHWTDWTRCISSKSWQTFMSRKKIYTHTIQKIITTTTVTPRPGLLDDIEDRQPRLSGSKDVLYLYAFSYVLQPKCFLLFVPLFTFLFFFLYVQQILNQLYSSAQCFTRSWWMQK